MDILRKLKWLSLILGLLIFSQNYSQTKTMVSHKQGPVQEYYKLEDYGKVVKYDTHIHINTNDTTFIKLAGEDNFRLLDIIVDRPFGLPMEEQQKLAVRHIKDYPELVSFATTFSVKNWNNENWQEETIADLKESVSQGAIAVKIWKNIGMSLKDKRGNFVMVDDHRLDSIIDYLAANNIPLIGHNGEPKDCWLPLDKMTIKGNKGYYSAHPEYHMYLHPDYPSYDAQISSRDHMLEKHPNLKFIGAHLGSLEWSLDELAKRLDKYPNMAVDLSRMTNLQYHAYRNWQKTRNFFIKYKDRLIYATDTQVGAIKNVSQTKKDLHDSRIRDWRFFTTDDIMSSPGFDGEFKGLKLPREVVDKIYSRNAEKWFPAIAKR